MAQYVYDFHIHSCLSPCGDAAMTPNNIVNMALLSECDVIAITDHNTCKNAPAVVQAGEAAGLLVIPGMELCVAEEIHVVCLFETLEGAMDFDAFVSAHMLQVENEPDIFGAQQLMNAQDEPQGLVDQLLLVASDISIDDVSGVVKAYGGVAFPAHIDRDSYSILSVLAGIPKEARFPAVELTQDCDRSGLCVQYPEVADYPVYRSSDAHYLETLSGEKCRASFSERSAKAVIEGIRKGSDFCP